MNKTLDNYFEKKFDNNIDKKRVAIYCVSKDGYSVAEKIREKDYSEADLFVSERVESSLLLKNTEKKNIVVVKEKISKALEGIFDKYDLHIFIAATGAVVRLISGKFKTKDVDPAVLSIDDKGTFVVSLLSGHLGNANEECTKIAESIGAIPVVTTASDVSGKIAVDTLAQKLKSNLESLENTKRVTALMVNGERVRLMLPEDLIVTDKEKNVAGAIVVSNRKKLDIAKIIPKNLFLGIGCKRGVTKEHIITKLKEVMNDKNLEMSAINMVASAWVKSDEIGLIEAMKELQLPIKFFEKEEIERVEHLIDERSEYVKKTIGVYGVSEPCAYLASSGVGKFLVKKVKLDGMTLSIFEEDLSYYNDDEV